MRVSVILPYYNAELTLQRAIQSILDQTFRDFELILIDNNSTDLSNDIARSAKDDDRVRLYLEPRQGVVHAANRGLIESRGELIARMDADDWSYPARLQKQVELLSDDTSLGIVSGMVVYDGDSSNIGFIRYLEWVNKVIEPNDIWLNQFVEFPIVNPSIMFRSELINKFGGYMEGNFPEDYEFFLRLQQAQIRMKKLNIPVIKWNDRVGRLTRTHPCYSEEAFENVRSTYLAQWLKENNPYFPDIWIWGSGKKARNRGKKLTLEGVQIKGFIEVSDKHKSDNLPIIHFEELPKEVDRFIVSYVANWGARIKIKDFLTRIGWKEGVDFILAA